MSLVFIVLMSAWSAFAGDLQVVGPHLTYKLNWGEQAFHFESPRAKLSMVQKPCNEALLKKLSLQMQRWEKGKVKGQENADVRYTINGKSYQVSQKSKFGRGLLAIPVEIERIKMEEKVLCK